VTVYDMPGAEVSRRWLAEGNGSGGQRHDGGDGGDLPMPTPPADAQAAPRKPTRSSTTTSGAFSDSRMAQILADDVLSGEFLWCKGLGWLRWTGQRFEDATEETVGEVIRQYVLDRFEDVIASMRTDPGQPTAAVNGWRSMLSVGRQRAVLTLARGIVECKAADLDADPDILNTPAGMVNLITGVISPHHPAALITKITKGSYRPGYSHPDWTAALEALPPGSQQWYQARVGQGITGHTTPDGILVILQGTGENGKSLVSTDGVLPALGDYADVASGKLITATAGTEHSTEMADLRGKRFLVAEEMTEDRALDVTAIKRIQDVGTIKARYVHKDNMTFRASHSLFATTNYVPRVDETDHGTWRRLALLKFPYTFHKPGEPLSAPTDRRGDPELKSRIRQGATGQHDAIVTWAVEGAVRVATAGTAAMAVPNTVGADTRTWRAVADRILSYWQERLIVDPEACVLAAELLDDFNDWITTNGHKKWSRETFSPKFAGHGETTRHGVEHRKVLHPKGLIRRHCSVWDPAPKPVSDRPWVWLGVRYRTTTDLDESDLVSGVDELEKTFHIRARAGSFVNARSPQTPRSSETPRNGSCEDQQSASEAVPDTEPRHCACGERLLMTRNPDGTERTQCEGCRIKEKEMTTDQIETRFPPK
jgi:P4 family phage/plasmid primase-like protien